MITIEKACNLVLSERNWLYVEKIVEDSEYFYILLQPKDKNIRVGLQNFFKIDKNSEKIYTITLPSENGFELLKKFDTNTLIKIPKEFIYINFNSVSENLPENMIEI